MSITGRSTLALAAAALLGVALPVVAFAQSAAPLASPSASAAARPLPDDPSPLLEGSYISNVGTGASLTFDVADGAWTGRGGRMAVLDREVAGDVGELIATTFRARVPDPCTDDMNVVLSLQPEAMDARSFTDWLVAQPWAVATTSETTLGGEPAIEVDISALTPPCERQILPWLYLDGGPYRLAPTEALRVIAQDRGDDLVLVTAETLHAESLPAFLEFAVPLIDSMTFGDPIEFPVSRAVGWLAAGCHAIG